MANLWDLTDADFEKLKVRGALLSDEIARPFYRASPTGVTYIDTARSITFPLMPNTELSTHDSNVFLPPELDDLTPYFTDLDKVRAELKEGIHITSNPEPPSQGLLKINPHLQNQGGRNTCVSFATTAAVESHLFSNLGSIVDLSEEFVHAQLYGIENISLLSNSGFDFQRLHRFIATINFVEEADWPYEPSMNRYSISVNNGTLPVPLAFLPVLVSESVYTTGRMAANFRLIECLITKGFPVLLETGMTGAITGNGYGAMTPALGPVKGRHAVLLYGFDRIKQVFLARNSASNNLPETWRYSQIAMDTQSILVFSKYAL